MEINTITAVIAALLSVIALLLIVIRWVMDSKKPPVNGNGNGTKQSRGCFEQHQCVISKLDLISRDVELLQKTMDSRTPLFQLIQDKIGDLNITIGRWDGSDRRK